MHTVRCLGMLVSHAGHEVLGKSGVPGWDVDGCIAEIHRGIFIEPLPSVVVQSQ